MSSGKDQSSKGLGYTIIGSLSRGSNSIFNDDVGGKISGSFISKESNWHCISWMRINRIFSSKIFKNQIWDKVRNAFKNILTPKSSSSMKTNENAYIYHNHDDVASSCMGGHTGKISQDNSVCHPHEQLVYYNEKIAFIEVIIDSKHQCKCIHTPLSWWQHQ